MIKIKRSKCPPTLRNSPLKGRRYNSREVVEALWEMQHGKCCYCEMKIPKKGHQKGVDHFRPQLVFKGLKNDWRNLLLACAQCNGKKSDKFPVDSEGRPLIIDPSHPDIDPEDHIDFIVDDREDDYGLIFEKNSSELGRITIEVIGLYDSFYTGHRREYLYDVLLRTYRDLLKAHDQGEGHALDSYKSDFAMSMSAKGKFAAFARAFARDRRLDERFDLRIPVGSDS